MSNKRFILLYHGVTRSKSQGIENFSNKHICANEFEKQIKFIRENMTPVTLREIAFNKNLGNRPIAITFDDTFKNVATVALPILKKYEVPATFFITSGFIDTDRIFWVDRLEHIINHAKKSTFILKHKSNKIFQINSHNEKIEAINQVKKIIKSSKEKIHDVVLEDIEQQLGITNHLFVENYKNLTSDLVKRLHKPPLYEIGGHTVNHEILTQLSDFDLKHEIQSCLKQLEFIVNKKIDLFSYPEGQKDHYNNVVIDAIKKEGIKICPTALTGFNNVNTSPYELKRIMVGFMGAEFPFEVINDKFIVRNIS